MKRVFKNSILFAIMITIAISFVSFRMNQNQVPYLSTKLSPYSGFSLMSSIKMETSAKIETGIGESLELHIGTGKQGNVPLYWMMIESSLFPGRFVSAFDESKNIDMSLNICRDTIKHVFRGDSVMIAFEMIHHLSTNEIQYIWLDGNNNRSEKAIFIPLDNPLQKGKKFPDLTVEQLNGEKLSFSDLAGKIVVINWWATTCGPCIAEMPGFNKLVEQYKENPNVVFIAIAQDKKERVTGFLEKNKFNYIQTLANNDAIKLFGTAMPVNVVINSAGRICHHSRGGYSDKYLEIERIIKGLVE